MTNNLESVNLLNENAKPHLISFNEGTIDDVDVFIDFLLKKILPIWGYFFSIKKNIISYYYIC